jgi:hypothetical protein
VLAEFFNKLLAIDVRIAEFLRLHAIALLAQWKTRFRNHPKTIGR